MPRPWTISILLFARDVVEAVVWSPVQSSFRPGPAPPGPCPDCSPGLASKLSAPSPSTIRSTRASSLEEKIREPVLEQACVARTIAGSSPTVLEIGLAQTTMSAPSLEADAARTTAGPSPPILETGVAWAPSPSLPVLGPDVSRTIRSSPPVLGASVARTTVSAPRLEAGVAPSLSFLASNPAAALAFLASKLSSPSSSISTRASSVEEKTQAQPPRRCAADQGGLQHIDELVVPGSDPIWLCPLWFLPPRAVSVVFSMIGEEEGSIMAAPPSPPFPVPVKAGGRGEGRRRSDRITLKKHGRADVPQTRTRQQAASVEKFVYARVTEKDIKSVARYLDWLSFCAAAYHGFLDEDYSAKMNPVKNNFRIFLSDESKPPPAITVTDYVQGCFNKLKGRDGHRNKEAIVVALIYVERLVVRFGIRAVGSRHAIHRIILAAWAVGKFHSVMSRIFLWFWVNGDHVVG